MLSIYIPLVLPNTTEEFVKEVFETNNIGTVSYIDFVFKGKNYSAYVHFSNLTSHPIVRDLENDKSCKLYFDYPENFEYKSGYWICLKNTSMKATSQTPKVRINITGLHDEIEEGEIVEDDADAAEEEEEAEAEAEEAEADDGDETEEEAEKDDENAWMEDLMEYGEDTNSDEWESFLKQYSREEEEKAQASMNHVRDLEYQIMNLQHVLDMNTYAWNGERTHLLNKVAHLQSEVAELYLTNRSLSGFLQNYPRYKSNR
jgi:hypothetical protein